jgi:hypothetical protein
VGLSNHFSEDSNAYERFGPRREFRRNSENARRGPKGAQVVQTTGVHEASARAQLEHRALGEGAAQAAPTAPHATPHLPEAGRTGPERFWAHGPVRVAFALCVVVSAIVHGSVVPIDAPHRLQLNDVEGEAAIPIDILAADDTPPPEPPAPSSETTASNEEKNPAAAATAGADSLLRRDAGPSRDAAVDAPNDVAHDSADGTSPAPLALGPIATDGEADFDVAIAHAAARADSGSGGTRDPDEIIGAESVRADVELVRLVVNVEVIRRHPVGERMGYLLRGVPQWNDFVSGTDIDPVRDADWVMISGPSLINTARDLIFIHYSAPDAVVDRAVRLVASKYDRGGPFDAGVRGMKASLVHADRADRVILRPQPHLLAVVPPSVAQKNARALAGGPIYPHIHPGEAVYLRLVNPHRPIPEIPESITEMRMRVVPRSDDGADIFVEGDTTDADTASQAADGVRRMVRRHNDAITSLLTHGLLDHVGVGTDASTVKLHLTATRDQIQTVVTLVGDFLGVQPDALSAPSATSPALPGSPSNLMQPR